jgi:hypothetical protein
MSRPSSWRRAPEPESEITFRTLYHALLQDDPEVDLRALLRDGPAGGALHATLAPLAPYRRPSSEADPYEVRSEDLFALYAASRVSDLMLMSFQGRVGEPAPIPALSEAEYLGFFQALGFQTFGERPYSPFYHEIVEVESARDPSSAIEVTHTFWPGLMFGDLLFARAGVRVRAHPARVQQEYAEETPLCFSYVRHRRRAADLSIGWGSNSQWRTAFRRDDRDGDVYRFNVDGEIDIGGAAPRVLDGMDDFNDDISIEARRELLVHRCFVTQPYPWSNLEDWPSRDTLTVSCDDPLVT